jgi:hypothetical protein
MDEQDKGIKEEKNMPTSDATEKTPKDISRRNALKALAGIPVAGLFGFELSRKINYDKNRRSRIVQELGLDRRTTRGKKRGGLRT